MWTFHIPASLEDKAVAFMPTRSPGLFSLEWMLDTQILPSIHSSPASWLSGRRDGHLRVADPTSLCLQVSPASGGGLSRGEQEGDCARAQGWSGTGSSHLPLLSLPGATATSNEEREHPDQKTEAKEPCQDQGLLRCEGSGGHSRASESHSNPAPHGCPSACWGRGR